MEHGSTPSVERGVLVRGFQPEAFNMGARFYKWKRIPPTVGSFVTTNASLLKRV